jgi:glycerate-2-kinase
VVRRLEAGARGELDENPAPAELRGVEHEVVGSLARSVEAAMARAVELGCEGSRLRGWITGEARTAGALLCDRVLGDRVLGDRVLGDRVLADPGLSEGLPPGSVLAGAPKFGVDAEDERRAPLALIGGGETVVTVTGDGVGGRAQELALGFASAAAGRIERPWALLAAGTDGRDGPGDAAGALVDARTLERARARGLDLREILDRNDSSRLLRATSDLLVTGPTGTNVGDVVILLLGW